MVRFHLGDLRITVLDAGTFWLDGGAMFGVVPKTLWEKERPADERNRIRLGLNLLLVEDGKRRILIDTGAGDKWDEKARRIYRLDSRGAPEFLAPAGLVPEQIDLVVNSHLHFDHAGGNTRVDASGDPVPAFPNATYLVQEGELETARSGSERTRASYLAENFEPLVGAGRYDLARGDVTVGSGLTLRVAPGHTPHMQIPVVAAGGKKLAFLADLVPTASHVPYPYIMGYDMEPMTTLATKMRVLPEAVRENWLLVFEHDAEIPIGTLEEAEGGRLRARPADLEER